jgi:D-tyrosyl-tRNA(Tyr) deacylase
MRVVVQRVLKAAVFIEEEVVGKIDKGYLLYIGISVKDDEKTAIKMAEKIHNLRVFEDENEKMNLNLNQVEGSILSISQFTLYGDTKGNNRPSFIEAARPEQANPLYELLNKELEKHHRVEKGIFGSHMKISSVNDGPVTIVIEM